MNLLPHALKATFATLAFALTAGLAQADLTAAEADQLRQLRGAPVLSSDGALVGRIEGASVSGDRTALFLKPASGDILPRNGLEIVIRTNTTEVSLDGNQIILNADRQRVRTKARIKKDDSDQIVVILPRI
ncbi:MAG: hypothetical protein AAGK77_07590 [Pseudomonadota bacterium]